MRLALIGWVLWGEWRAHPWRACLSVVAIAAGVGLGFCVHVVNGSAIDEFQHALGTLSGRADLDIRARADEGFDQSLYAHIAALPQVQLAAPMIEAHLAVEGSPVVLSVVGMDPLSAVGINPQLAASVPLFGDATGHIDSQAIALSSSTLRALHEAVGATVRVIVNGAPVALHITRQIDLDDADLAVMDIAAAQWRLQRLGRLSRIAVRAAPGVSVEQLRQALAPLLPTDALIATPGDGSERIDRLSRAYRVNLDMLALMALFTGAFLVYSSQSLSVFRRRREMALLRVIGVTRRDLLAQILLEGGVLGALGSALGLGLGTGVAALLLRVVGADLGGGYFFGSARLIFPPVTAAAFFVLGLGASLLGSMVPARLAQDIAPALVLKASDESIGSIDRLALRTALGLALGAGLCLLLPPIDGLPIGAYVAMALLLFMTIAAMPALAKGLVGSLRRLRAAKPLPWHLSIERLWSAPTQGTIALCGIVSSVSLIVAMAVMVASFRHSVDQWVVQILPADLYLHLEGPSSSVALDRPLQTALKALEGVARIDYLRSMQLSLAADRPAVTLLVRDFDDAPPAGLPILQMAAAVPRPPQRAVFISEAMQMLYGWQIGQTRELPLGDRRAKNSQTTVVIAGIWRDYARQNGALVMRASDYLALTGDDLRTDAGIYLTPGADASAVAKRVLRALPEAIRSHASVTDPKQIRKASLAVFDRSFFITYLLEAVAIAIGLAGVAATFSAQTIARAREFGMLRHLGVKRLEVLGMLASEGLLLGLIGVIVGLALGFLQGAILIQVVNPQSFHWTMQTHIPWSLLGLISVAMLLCSCGTAVLAGRGALSRSAIRAVGEDW